MDFATMKKALEIISQCDCLSITENGKELIIFVFDEILKALGGGTTEMKIRYEILKISTWSDGYFSTSARQLCSSLYPIIKILAETGV